MPSAKSQPPREILWEETIYLKFDPNNPRLPEDVDKTNDDNVLRFMLQSGNILELMGAISEQGFFPGEALLVVEDKTVPGTYIVVEGNRRLAAVKILLNPELAPVRKTSVRNVVAGMAPAIKESLGSLPILVFPDRRDILVYLGYRHITGIQTWGPLAKAEYLDQLLEMKRTELASGDNEQNSAELDQILAKDIGSRADHVGQLLAGLALYRVIRERDFFDIEGLTATTINFGVLYTAIGYENIADYLGMEGRRDRGLADLDENHLENLTKWLFEKTSSGSTVVGESRNLANLDAVLESPDATKSLEDGATLEEAYSLSKGPLQDFLATLKECRSSINEAWTKYRLVEKVGIEEIDIVKEIVRTATRLRTSMDAQFDSEE